VARTHILRIKPPVRMAHETATKDLLKAQDALLSPKPGSKERALVLYERAAAFGSAVAEYNIGFCYETGLGVASDLDQAAAWYRKAASHGRGTVKRLAAEGLQSVRVAGTDGPSPVASALPSGTAALTQ
jgi:TPR repeat protein